MNVILPHNHNLIKLISTSNLWEATEMYFVAIITQASWSIPRQATKESTQVNPSCEHFYRNDNSLLPIHTCTAEKPSECDSEVSSESSISGHDKLEEHYCSRSCH